MYQQEAAWCITLVFNFVALCITSQDSLSENVTPKCVSFQFYFLTYLFNNISTRDINSFKSSYIYSFMSVLDWSIMPYRKTCFVFTKPLLAPKQLIFKQSVCICKQINVSQFILHTCDLSYLPWKSQKWHLHDVSRVLHEKLMYRVTEWLRSDIHIVPDQILVRTKQFWSWNLVLDLLGPGAVYISTQNFGLLLQ